jgi:class 3 adenylate cyclase
MTFNRFKTNASRFNLTATLRRLFTTEYSSSDEKYFVNLAMERRRRVNGDITIRLGVIYNIILPVVSQFVATSELLPLITSFHLTLLALTLPMFLPLFRFKAIIENVGRKYVLPLTILMPSLFYASIAATKFPTFPEPRHALLMNHIYTVSILIMLIHPGHRWQRFLSMIFLAVVAYFAFYRHPVGSAISAFAFLSLVLCYMNTVWLENQNCAIAKREFALMIQAAPAKIVRQASLSNDDLGHAFAPTQRHCVCISSDWRGYQAISASIAPEQLAAALGSYYEMVDRLLADKFQDGNYYSDWIADELFVVVFAKDTLEEKVLINAALSFANGLIEKKQKFVDISALEINIDIGISSGVSLIGMMGPPGHRKATALGDVPGQARRFQMAGKYLRSKFGESDRVIFGSNSLMQITEPFEIKQFDLSEDEKIRDLGDRALFYMEPVMSTVRRAV